jgi:fibronectin type 3 domain-containing protein
VSGAEGYRISRSTGSGNSYTQIKTTTSTTYTDTGLTPSTTYYYRVTAYKGQVESNAATTSGTTTSSGGTIPPPPPAPTGLKVSDTSSGSVSLFWNSAANADSYDIYRRNSKDGAEAKIGTETGTAWTDYTVGAGALYYYTIKAVNSSGNSPESNKAFAVAISHYSLQTYSSSYLTNLSAASKHYYRLAVTAGQGITITWQNGSSQNTDGSLRVSVWQNDGTAVFTDNGYYARGGYADPLVFTAATAGYVTVEVRNGHNSNSFNYQIYR